MITFTMYIYTYHVYLYIFYMTTEIQNDKSQNVIFPGRIPHSSDCGRLHLVPYSADAITLVLPSQFSRARHNNVATYSAFCPISGFPQEGARLFRAVPRGPVIPSEDDTIKIAMLTSAALRDASGGTGCKRTTVQKRAMAGDGGGGEKGDEGGRQHPGGTRGRVLVSSFRSAASRKGIILIADSLGRPNSTPCFYSLSLPLSVFVPLLLSFLVHV